MDFWVKFCWHNINNMSRIHRIITCISGQSYYHATICVIKWCEAALFLTSNVLDLANKVHKALWGFDLEAVSDSCEKNDWTLKKVEREGPLLRAWVITLHPPPHPQPNCLFFVFFSPCRLEIYWATFSQLVRFIFTLNLWQVLCKLVRITLWVKTEQNKLKLVFKKLLQ